MKEFNLGDHIVDDPRSAHVGYIHAPWVKEFVKQLKEYNPQKCKAIHRNSCGEPIRDNEGNVQIYCGEDLGDEINHEFAQCSDCRFKDYIDEQAGDGLK